MLSLEEFYADATRKNSKELRFGSEWRSPDLPGWVCGIFWVADTNELCALWSPEKGLRSDGPVSRWILGIPPHTRAQPPDEDELSVEVLVQLEKGELQLTLKGWEEHADDPEGFDWLRSAVEAR